MVARKIAYLIAESPDAHGAWGSKTRTERKVFVTVSSVTRSEYYEAHNAGFEPSVVLTLAWEKSYHGERYCRYDDQIYNIIRTYTTKTGGLEMTLERSDVK